MRSGRRRERETVGSTGVERSGTEVEPTARRGRPGRRSVDDRVQAVLELLSGKTTVDQLATRFGVRASTVQAWREEAVAFMAEAMRQGRGRSEREVMLEKKLRSLERAFTDLAIRHELAERAIAERPTRPGRSY